MQRQGGSLRLQIGTHAYQRDAFPSHSLAVAQVRGVTAHDCMGSHGVGKQPTMQLRTTAVTADQPSAEARCSSVSRSLMCSSRHLHSSACRSGLRAASTCTRYMFRVQIGTSGLCRGCCRNIAIGQLVRLADRVLTGSMPPGTLPDAQGYGRAHANITSG